MQAGELDDRQYIVEVAWDRPDLPGLIGPFDSRAEAERWGQLNVPNGAWLTAPLAYPYARSGEGS